MPQVLIHTKGVLHYSLVHTDHPQFTHTGRELPTGSWLNTIIYVRYSPEYRTSTIIQKSAGAQILESDTVLSGELASVLSLLLPELVDY